MTADKGSNIKKAIVTSKTFCYVPCFSHVMHRVILAALSKVSMVMMLKKLTRLGGMFNRSPVVVSFYEQWCTMNNK